MEHLSTPRVLISGVASGVGKSLVTIGLVQDLRRRGLSVSSCVIGSHFIESTVLRRLSGRYSRCLDDRVLSSRQLLMGMFQSGIGADILVIEGSGGLFDGRGAGSLRGSDAEYAALSHTPVILVADTRGFATSFVALIKGFTEFARGFDIGGVVANRIAPGDDPESRNREFYDASLQTFRMRPLLGGIPNVSLEASPPEKTLSQEKNLTVLPRQFLVQLCTLIAEHIDIDQLLRIAQTAPPVSIPEFENAPSSRRARIAVSEDSCFNLCYQDNLDILRYFGAEIVPFSPLADSSLPKKIGAVYLTGAYLRDYGEDLSRNEAMYRELRAFADAGGVVFSEGGGTAYICNDFRLAEDDRVHRGVGIIPASAVSKSYDFGYSEITTAEESVLGRSGLILKGIGTSEWHISREERMLHALKITDSKGVQRREGYSPGAQIVSTFDFCHFGSNPEVARNIVDAAQVVLPLQK